MGPEGRRFESCLPDMKTMRAVLSKRDLLLGKLTTLGVARIRSSETLGETTLVFHMIDGSKRSLTFPNSELKGDMRVVCKRAEDILTGVWRN